MSRHPITGCLAAISLLVGACADPTPPPTAPGDAPTVRQQVAHGAPLALTEVWRRGHQGDPEGVEFFSLNAVEVTGDGTHMAMDRGNHEILRLSEDGLPLGRFGRQGDGPGEWQDAFVMAWARDTLAILDANNRIHFFDASGQLHVTHQLEFPDPLARGGSLLGSSTSGWVVSAAGFFRSGPDGEPLQPVQREIFYRLDPTSGRLSPAGLHWAQEWVGTMETGLGAQPILTASPAAAVDGAGRFVLADTSTYRIDVYAFDGTHEMRIENQVERLPLTDDLIGLWRASRDCPEGPIEVVECSSGQDRLIESLPREEFRPVVGRIRAFTSGHIAALRNDLDPNPFDQDSPSIYDYFSPEGAFIGYTEGLIPLWFNGTHLLALERDELDVSSLVRYRLGG